MVRSDGEYCREFVSGDLRRLEMYGADGSLLHLFIYRPDEGLSWASMAGSKVLYEILTSPSNSNTEADELIVWTREEFAVIEGCECIRFVGRYRIAGKTVWPAAAAPLSQAVFTEEDHQAAAGKAYEVCFIDAANGLVCRHVTYDRAGKRVLVTDRRAFDVRPPEPAMFEIPEGYSLQRAGE
jgi:hypothetical protein